jgi:hypothetical protein
MEPYPRDRRIRRVPGSCPPVVQAISPVPDEPGDSLTIQRLIGSLATKKDSPHALLHSQRLKGAEAQRGCK